MIRQQIADLIQKSIIKAQQEKRLPKFRIPEILVEVPEIEIYGDYATNIAMQIAKIVKVNPVEIAEIISSKFKVHPVKSPLKRGARSKNEQFNRVKSSKLFKKVEIIKPGFINFFLSESYLQKQVKEILKQGKNFGKVCFTKRSAKTGCRKAAFNKVNIEFISANPTGPLHIGHGRIAFFGDCLANVLENAGYKVIREYYINNAKNSAQIQELGKTAIGKGKTYLNVYLKSRILNLKSQLEKLSNESEAGYLLAQEVQKDIKNFVEKELKIKFDNWISEQDFYKKGEVDKIYNWLKKKNLIYKKEGAEWLKTSKFGDKKDWVIIRKDGHPTYLLSDIAYHKYKFDREFDKVINIWGADHQGHALKIKAVGKILKFKGKLDILISQIVRLKGAKISKRKGETITLKWLVDEVGLDAARFFYLMKSLDTQMEFDIELAKEKSEKSPVYYVQYAYARIHSILKKSKIQNYKSQINPKSKIQNPKFQLLNHPSELQLIKQLIKFPEILEDTAKDYRIQRIPQYAINLATSFHQFYRDCKVLTEDKKLRNARLGLILAVEVVLKNSLELMGISAPEKM